MFGRNLRKYRDIIKNKNYEHYGFDALWERHLHSGRKQLKFISPPQRCRMLVERLSINLIMKQFIFANYPGMRVVLVKRHIVFSLISVLALEHSAPVGAAFDAALFPFVSAEADDEQRDDDEQQNDGTDTGGDQQPCVALTGHSAQRLWHLQVSCQNTT